LVFFGESSFQRFEAIWVFSREEDEGTVVPGQAVGGSVLGRDGAAGFGFWTAGELGVGVGGLWGDELLLGGTGRRLCRLRMGKPALRASFRSLCAAARTRVFRARKSWQAVGWIGFKIILQFVASLVTVAEDRLRGTSTRGERGMHPDAGIGHAELDGNSSRIFWEAEGHRSSVISTAKD